MLNTETNEPAGTQTKDVLEEAQPANGKGKAGTEAADLRRRRRPGPAGRCDRRRHHAAGPEVQRRLCGAGGGEGVRGVRARLG